MTSARSAGWAGFLAAGVGRASSHAWDVTRRSGSASSAGWQVWCCAGQGAGAGGCGGDPSLGAAISAWPKPSGRADGGVCGCGAGGGAVVGSPRPCCPRFLSRRAPRAAPRGGPRPTACWCGAARRPSGAGAVGSQVGCAGAVGRGAARSPCWLGLRAGSGLAPGWLRAGSGLAPGRTSARSPPWAGVAGSPEGCSAATIRGAARSPL